MPSLDLRFASQKNLNDYMTGQNLITFSRPVGANQSPGTYVDENGIIQLSSADTPRFDHDPTTGESLGLLVEEQRANLLLRSQEFDNSYWTLFPVGDTTIVPDAVTAPDGTLTADKLVEGTSTGRHYIEKLFYPGASTTYTFSVYVKAAGRTQVVIYPNAQTAFSKYVAFNLSSGVVIVENGSNITGNIQRLANEWFRVSITTASGSNSQYSPIIGLTNNTGPTYTDSAASYTGDGTSGIYIWGAQLEAGSFPTSYIPTTSTALTRSADAASITGTNFSSWYNQSEGTVFSELGREGPGQSARFQIAEAGTSNRVQARAGNLYCFNSTQQFYFFYTSATKEAFALSNSSTSVSNNGNIVATAGTISLPACSQLELGARSNLDYLNGTISRLTYFPYRIPDANLQAMTAS